MIEKVKTNSYNRNTLLITYNYYPLGKVTKQKSFVVVITRIDSIDLESEIQSIHYLKNPDRHTYRCTDKHTDKHTELVTYRQTES